MMLDGEHEYSLTFQSDSFVVGIHGRLGPNGDHGHGCSASISGEALGHSAAAAAQPSICSAYARGSSSWSCKMEESGSRHLSKLFTSDLR